MGLSAAFILGMLASCSEDVETVAPEQPAEETGQLLPDAVLTAPPETGEVEEDISSLPFPGESSSNARIAAGGVTDYVDFNDPFALSIIPDQAQYTFAASPFYIQQVGNGWIHVKENNSGNYNPAFKSNYGHYHLSYQNFTPCTKQNGQFGKPYGGGCININPIQEPRTLDTHNGSQWIKIYAYDYNSSSRVFDLKGIKVTNGPIQIWFKKTNGLWYKWLSVGEGTWNFSSVSSGVTQVLISSASGGTVGFDNVKIHMPAY